MKFALKIILHIMMITVLTAVTQTGGIIYLISILLVKQKTQNKRLKRIGLFAILYLCATFLIVPYIAPMFGREKIKETEFLKAHSFFYKLANRNYVRPILNKSIEQLAFEFGHRNTGIMMVYLDANFPFFNQFPLLPHLSHHDGKKIDVSLIYESEGKLTNRKPSISGYGVYEMPRKKEYDQTSICKIRGFWQYDFTKYLTLGAIKREIVFSESGTRQLIELILK